MVKLDFPNKCANRKTRSYSMEGRAAVRCYEMAKLQINCKDWIGSF